MLIKNIKIDTISKDYKGICYVNDFKCFVDEAITGDVLDIEIYKETNKFYFAKIKKIITPSSYRNTNIECEYYKKCGGCALQHLNLDYYYKLKEDYINLNLGYCIYSSWLYYKFFSSYFFIFITIFNSRYLFATFL